MGNDEATEWVWPYRPFAGRRHYGSSGVKVRARHWAGIFASGRATVPTGEDLLVPPGLPGSWLRNANGSPVGLAMEYYRPTDEDLDLVRHLWPGIADPGDPPWSRVEAELTVAGTSREELVRMNALGLLSSWISVAQTSTGSSPGWAESPRRENAHRGGVLPPHERATLADDAPGYKSVMEIIKKYNERQIDDANVTRLGLTTCGGLSSDTHQIHAEEDPEGRPAGE